MGIILVQHLSKWKQCALCIVRRYDPVMDSEACFLMPVMVTSLALKFAALTPSFNPLRCCLPSIVSLRLIILALLLFH